MVAAVVVAYKNKQDLVSCYEQLRKSPQVQDIFIVDNSHGEVGSCFEYAGLRNLDEHTHHVVAPSNLGYAAGNNLGIARARERGADCILVCNPDVLVHHATVRSLLEEMDERGLDLISPRLLEEDVTGTYEILSSPGWDRWFGRGVINVPSIRKGRRYVPTFYGACFLMTARLADALGGLSEDFFLYGEEIDYTLRIRRSPYAWGISERSTVPHGRGSSISPLSTKSVTSFFHSARSAVIVGRKYWPAVVIPWIIARSALAFVLAVRGKRSQSKAVIGGLFAGCQAPLT